MKFESSLFYGRYFVLQYSTLYRMYGTPNATPTRAVSVVRRLRGTGTRTWFDFTLVTVPTMIRVR